MNSIWVGVAPFVGFMFAISVYLALRACKAKNDRSYVSCVSCAWLAYGFFESAIATWVLISVSIEPASHSDNQLISYTAMAVLVSGLRIFASDDKGEHRCGF